MTPTAQRETSYRTIELQAAQESKAVPIANPTRRVYDGLDAAYDFFNQALFQNSLPRCLITMQRKSKAYGYFAGDRFGELTGPDHTADEIALNPQHFAGRSSRETLSTLVHEMVHLWQHHHGKAGQGGYHNKQWVAQMQRVGLQPSDTAAPGGRETGQKVSHYIVDGGAFDTHCDRLLAAGFTIPYGDLWAVDAVRAKLGAAKKASKTKFSCPVCDEVNAWGKADLQLKCGVCDSLMIAAETKPAEA